MNLLQSIILTNVSIKYDTYKFNKVITTGASGVLQIKLLWTNDTTTC